VADVTAIAVAAISGGAALGGAWLQAYTSTRVNAETRRNERQQTYVAAIDLLTDHDWRTQYEPSYSANIVQEFTIPFLHTANRVRLYCSPASIAAMDELQEAFASGNVARTDPEVRRGSPLRSRPRHVCRCGTRRCRATQTGQIGYRDLSPRCRTSSLKEREQCGCVPPAKFSHTQTARS
jgi:hypothetical protein